MQLHKNGYRKSDKKSVKSISLFLPLTFSFHFPSFPLRTRHFPFLVCPLRHNPIPLLSLATPFSLFNFFRFSLLPLLIDLLSFLIFIYLVLFFSFPVDTTHHTEEALLSLSVGWRQSRLLPPRAQPPHQQRQHQVMYYLAPIRAPLPSSKPAAQQHQNRPYDRISLTHLCGASPLRALPPRGKGDTKPPSPRRVRPPRSQGKVGQSSTLNHPLLPLSIW
jgi:hypothetical protein